MDNYTLMVLLVMFFGASAIIFAIKWANVSFHSRMDRIRDGKIIDKLHEEKIAANDAYSALEIGMDEQQESFEQEYLSFADRINELTATIELQRSEILQLEATIEDHDLNCMPRVNETNWKTSSDVSEDDPAPIFEGMGG